MLSWIYCFTFTLGASIVVDDILQHATQSERNESNAIGSCQAKGLDRMQQHENSKCGVWLALSTIPGAGIGMFAGKEFRQRKNLLPGGDPAIPIVDLVGLPRQHAFFLWDEYTWVRFRTIACREVFSSCCVPRPATFHMARLILTLLLSFVSFINRVRLQSHYTWKI